MTSLYVYVMTSDSGFAPCIYGGLLTLACCKKRTRRMAARDYYNKNEVWVLGVCGKGLSKGTNRAYKPIYLAKVTDVKKMVDYYSTNEYEERVDHTAYKVLDNGKLKATENNPHTEKNQQKDIEGEFVLFSDNFVYWGDKCGEEITDIEKDFPQIFHSCIEGNLKCGIDRHNSDHIVERNFEEFSEKVKTWDWFPKSGAKIIGSPINKEYNCNQECNDEKIKRGFSWGSCES